MSKKNKPCILAGLLLSVTVLIMFSCRGQTSEEPPIHLNPNMDSQNKFKAYGENDFFEDRRDMRHPPEGTVAQGELREDEAYYLGQVGDTVVGKIPVPITLELMERGQDRYNIYCSVCHGEAGMGDGVVIKRGFIPPPSLHDQRILDLKDGDLFNIITNGIRNMPAYRKQVPVADRWAIVAYIRALQKSQNAMLSELPENKRAQIK